MKLRRNLSAPEYMKKLNNFVMNLLVHTRFGLCQCVNSPLTGLAIASRPSSNILCLCRYRSIFSSRTGLFTLKEVSFLVLKHLSLRFDSCKSYHDVSSHVLGI